jgi:hypothetical protein
VTAGTSHFTSVRQAVRHKRRARVFLSGPTGAGKTYSSLYLATFLADGGKVLLIDTEGKHIHPETGQLVSASEWYADRFPFDLLVWQGQYDPRDLAVTIHDAAAAGYDTIIIDSLTHFWTGEGGTLDIADGKFGGWKVATPAQRELVSAILNNPANIIGLARAQMEYAVSEQNGKQKVEALGVAPVQRGDFAYEFDVVGMIDITHSVSIFKTRAETLADRTFAAGTGPLREFATLLRDELNSGRVMASTEQLDVLNDLQSRIKGDDAKRAQAKDLMNERGWKSFLGLTQQEAHDLAGSLRQILGSDPEPPTPRRSTPTPRTRRARRLPWRSRSRCRRGQPTGPTSSPSARSRWATSTTS